MPLQDSITDSWPAPVKIQGDDLMVALKNKAITLNVHEMKRLWVYNMHLHYYTLERYLIRTINSFFNNCRMKLSIMALLPKSNTKTIIRLSELLKSWKFDFFNGPHFRFETQINIIAHILTRYLLQLLNTFIFVGLVKYFGLKYKFDSKGLHAAVSSYNKVLTL